MELNSVPIFFVWVSEDMKLMSLPTTRKVLTSQLLLFACKAIVTRSFVCTIFSDIYPENSSHCRQTSISESCGKMVMKVIYTKHSNGKNDLKDSIVTDSMTPIRHTKLLSNAGGEIIQCT